MNRSLIAFLLLVLAAQASAQPLQLRYHDCLGATPANPVTITSGSSRNGNEVQPLGGSHELSGVVTFTGSGKLTVTVQTRRAGSTDWCTPSVGSTALTAVSAGSHHFLIAVPVCDSLRLVFAATVASVEVTDAVALDQ